MSTLVAYYSTLYESKRTYTTESLHQYLDTVQLPQMSSASRMQLDAPLTLKELQLATGVFPNLNAPGDDGLPVEVYKQYADCVLPELLKVFNEVRGSSPNLCLELRLC